MADDRCPVNPVIGLIIVIDHRFREKSVGFPGPEPYKARMLWGFYRCPSLLLRNLASDVHPTLKLLELD